MSRWSFQGTVNFMEKCYCFLCSPFLSRKFTNVGETVFVVSRGIFRKIFPKVLRFLFLWTLSKVFGVSPNIFLQDCQNCFFCVQRTFMGKRVFLIENLYQFPSFSDFERNQFVFSWKNSDILVKIAFHMSQESFRGVFFLKLCACSFFVVCSKTVWTFIGKLLKVP